jgi:hypothetical protein
MQAITEHGLYQRTPDQIPDGEWGKGMVTLVGDAAHTAYVDGTGLALSLGKGQGCYCFNAMHTGYGIECSTPGKDPCWRCCATRWFGRRGSGGAVESQTRLSLRSRSSLRFTFS